jgi:hypothetical protein
VPEIKTFLRNISTSNRAYGYAKSRVGQPLQRQSMPALISPVLSLELVIDMQVGLLQAQTPAGVVYIRPAPRGAGGVGARGRPGPGGLGRPGPGGLGRPHPPGPGPAGGGGRGQGGRGAAGGGGGGGGRNGARQQRGAVRGRGDNCVDDHGAIAGGRNRTRSASIISLSDDVSVISLYVSDSEEPTKPAQSTPKRIFLCYIDFRALNF